jgi:hypothetical protein
MIPAQKTRHTYCLRQYMDTDARYERPCRWLLAVAGGIHWIAAALVISDGFLEIESASQYARVLQNLVVGIVQALT